MSATEVWYDRYAVARPTTGAASLLKLTTGETSSVSWLLPVPRKSLSMIANPPLPPVRLPRLPPSVDVQTPPLPLSSFTVHEDGMPLLKFSTRPTYFVVYPGAPHVEGSTLIAMFLTTSEAPSFTVKVRGVYPGCTGVTVTW